MALIINNRQKPWRKKKSLTSHTSASMATNHLLSQALHIALQGLESAFIKPQAPKTAAKFATPQEFWTPKIKQSYLIILSAVKIIFVYPKASNSNRFAPCDLFAFPASLVSRHPPAWSRPEPKRCAAQGLGKFWKAAIKSRVFHGSFLLDQKQPFLKVGCFCSSLKNHMFNACLNAVARFAISACLLNSLCLDFGCPTSFAVFFWTRHSYTTKNTF